MKKNSILQLPNLPLIIWLIAWLLARVLPYGQLNFAAALVSFGALFTWAWLEIFEGDNSFRRILGAVVMTYLIVSRL